MEQQSTEKQVQVKELVIKFYKEWKEQVVHPSEIKTQTLFSFTNDVYKVMVDNMPILLLKVYQPTLEEFTDNQLQTELVVNLSKNGFYPSVLFTAPTYRIEEFVSSVPITQETLNEDRLLRIMSQLGTFSSTYKNLVSSYNEAHKITNRYDLQRLLRIFKDIYAVKLIECPDLVSKCQSQIETVLNDTKFIARLSAILDKTQLVLSHNDCHLGNILANEQREFILDYQFSQFNYVGFDLANFLNEWSIQYGETFEIKEELQMNKALQEKISAVYYQQLSKVYNIGTSENWARYTTIGRVLSHFFWMIIGLKQINDPRIHFCMVRYVIRRKEELYKHFALLNE